LQCGIATSTGCLQGEVVSHVEVLALTYTRKITQIQETNLLKDLADMQKYAQERHQEVLQLIEDLSDGTTSDKASSVCVLRTLSKFND
jgi:hypothetical protein